MGFVLTDGMTHLVIWIVVYSLKKGKVIRL